jgi:hypothetical protein
MFGGCFVVRFHRRLVAADGLADDHVSDLFAGDDRSEQATLHLKPGGHSTRCLNLSKSCGVSVSALATTGIKLTRLPNRFIVSISRGFNLVNHQKRKKKKVSFESMPYTCNLSASSW